MPIKYRPATTADLGAIARVGSAAFDQETDPMMRRIFPVHLQQPGVNPQLAWREWRKTSRLNRDPNSAIIVAVDDKLDEIVGYAWWITPSKPGQKPFLPPEEPEFPGFDSEARKEVIVAIKTTEEFIFGKTENHYELNILAVDPKHGRKGIGRNLVQWGLEKAKNEQKDAFLLATAMGKPLYERLGFVAIGKVSFLGVVLDSMIVKNNPDTKLENGRVVGLNAAEAANSQQTAVP